MNEAEDVKPPVDAGRVDPLVMRPFGVPTGDVIRGIVKQIESGTIVVRFPTGLQHGWVGTLTEIANYLDRVESRPA